MLLACHSSRSSPPSPNSTLFRPLGMQVLVDDTLESRYCLPNVSVQTYPDERRCRVSRLVIIADDEAIGILSCLEVKLVKY